MFETVAEVSDPAVARVLIAALQAHGLHPREGADGGLPGLPGVYGPRGIPIEVPEDEAEDGRLLTGALLEEMSQR